MRLQIGKLDIEAGGLRHRRLGMWLPDALHMWWGDRGVHMFWARSRHMPRVTFDRVEL